MRIKKSTILLLIFVLTIGFATISTILNMNGSLALGENDLKVKFNRSLLNGANRPTFINKEGNIITFGSGDLIEEGESVLDYEVVNMSRQYDANVQVTCTTDAKNVTINNPSEPTRLNSGDVITGNVSLVSTKREETGEVPSDAIKLYDYIKGQSKGLDTTVGLDYNEVNKEHGVYETTSTDSGKSVYFYRGLVNNKIIYANKCWDIVRTTETGGTKLLYAGIPVNGSCDQSKVLSGATEYIGSSVWVEKVTTDKEVADVGYMHGKYNASSYEEAHENLYDSDIKKKVDNWYEKNIKDTKYEEMLEDTVYCNDRSVVKDFSTATGDMVLNTTVECEVSESDPDCKDGKKVVENIVTLKDYYKDNLGYGTHPTLFKAATRLGTGTLGNSTNPTLKCEQLNDRFTVSDSIGNGDLKYPIALLTADEAIYAGTTDGWGNRSNFDNYLYRKDRFSSNIDYTSISFWLMTPLFSHPQGGNMMSVANYKTNARLGHDHIKYTTSSIIPTISLNNENYIVSGEGSVDDPFILFTKGTVSDKVTCTLDMQRIEREELGEEFDGVRSLYESVKLLSLGTDKENNINYNKISSDSNGKGVYETSDTDSGKKVYFYRGNVEDNNVIFADKCWQIVRTTSSNGTKLIYNGEVLEDGSCNSSGEERGIGLSSWNSVYGDNTYAGYMYGTPNASTYEETHQPVSDTVIKTMIDSWYEENIKDTKYEELLEDIVFCNEKSVETDFSNYTYPGWLKVDNYKNDGSGTKKTLYQGSGRVGINAGITKPTLTCSQLNDRFTVSNSIGNGALKYPIGLLSADEVVYAGSTGGFQGKNTEANNFDYYLFVGGKHTWTMTPHRADANNIMLVIGAEGNIGNEVVQMDNVLVRPVISIRSDIMIVDGNGTKISPYILKAKKEVDESKIPSEWKDNGIFKEYYVDAYTKLNTLTVEEKVGQLIMAHHNQKTAIEGVTKYNIGGYTYFEPDFLGKTEGEVKKMIADEQAASKIPLITAVDEEGGRVVRIASNTSLVSNEMSKYPNLFSTNINNKNAWKLSKDLYRESGNNFTLIEQETRVKSAVLKRLGLNVNFAPVVDMAIEGAYISDRVIGLDARGTAEYGKTVIKTSKETGVSYCLKHFPGYGNNSDTHDTGSVDNKTLEELMENDIVPFKESIDVGAESVMLAHNIVAAIDANNPASLSKGVHDLLVNELNFTGIMITDALDMGATKDIPDKFVKAVKAGNHLLLVQDYARAYTELNEAVKNGSISEDELNKQVFKVLAWKYYKGLL